MEIDRLILVIIQKQDADAVIQALTQAGLTVTLIATAGGFLGAGNVTLLIGLRATEVEHTLELLHASCHPRIVPVDTAGAHTETRVSGATIFISPVARYIRLRADGVTVDSHPDAQEVGAMKLILAIVAQEQTSRLLQILTDWSYRATMISTTGGFQKRGNGTVLVGVRSERVDSIVAQIRQIAAAHPRDTAALATIFVLDLARFERM